MLHRQEVKLLAIGAGPANLALAVALEELAPGLARDTLVVEQHDEVVWQPGMLMPWAKTQVSFMKDLVTPRNPRSKFSFINYMHSIGRLDEFINLGTFTPYRMEISDYLRWVARSLANVRIEHSRRCVEIEPRYSAGGEVARWDVRTADGGQITCRTLVIGTGRDAYIPEPIMQIPRERVIHSTEFSDRLSALDPDTPHKIVVLGGGQSAAEMLWSAHQGLPRAQCTMMMRSTGLNYYQTSRFTNEMFYPSFIDQFYSARPEARDQMLAELHRHSFSGLTASMLDTLYQQMYLERLTGTERLRITTMADLLDARLDDDEIVLTYADRMTGQLLDERCDVVMLGTGFANEMPKMIRDLAAAAGVDEATVDRSYRLNLPTSFTASCYLQGVNDATHGPGDSQMSVLAVRSAEIVSSLLAQQQNSELLARAS